MSWIKNRLLKHYLRNLLDKVSGPLNGHKTTITAVLLLLQVVVNLQLCGDYCAIVSTIMTVIADAIGTTPQALESVTAMALIGSVFHRWTKKPEEKPSPGRG